MNNFIEPKSNKEVFMMVKYRKVLNFNTDWHFIGQDIEDVKNIHTGNYKFENVNLPNSNKITPHQYFEE